jgi:hypothetical protein
MFRVALVIPPEAFIGFSMKFVQGLAEKYAKKLKKNFSQNLKKTCAPGKAML